MRERDDRASMIPDTYRRQRRAAGPAIAPHLGDAPGESGRGRGVGRRTEPDAAEPSAGEGGAAAAAVGAWRPTSSLSAAISALSAVRPALVIFTQVRGRRPSWPLITSIRRASSS